MHLCLSMACQALPYADTLSMLTHERRPQMACTGSAVWSATSGLKLALESVLQWVCRAQRARMGFWMVRRLLPMRFSAVSGSSSTWRLLL